MRREDVELIDESSKVVDLDRTFDQKTQKNKVQMTHNKRPSQLVPELSSRLLMLRSSRSKPMSPNQAPIKGKNGTAAATQKAKTTKNLHKRTATQLSTNLNLSFSSNLTISEQKRKTPTSANKKPAIIKKTTARPYNVK